MRIKIDEYFRSGALLVWLIDPESRSARVYTAQDKCEMLDENGVLDGRDVLCGFRCRLGDLLDKVPRQAR
jgi:Uma2 family endonuclease